MATTRVLLTEDRQKAKDFANDLLTAGMNGIHVVQIGPTDQIVLTTLGNPAKAYPAPQDGKMFLVVGTSDQISSDIAGIVEGDN